MIILVSLEQYLVEATVLALKLDEMMVMMLVVM
jgi:hypothetical protein